MVAIGKDVTAAGIGYATDNTDQRGLTCAVGAQQREDFTSLDIQVDLLQGLKAVPVSLVEILDGYDRLHGFSLSFRLRARSEPIESGNGGVDARADIV